MGVGHVQTCGAFKERFHVIRRVRYSDQQAGSTVQTQDLGPIDGRLEDTRISKEEFAGQIRLLRSASLWLLDTVGVKPDDRVRDADGKVWDIVAFAQHGDNLRELFVKEAVGA